MRQIDNIVLHCTAGPQTQTVASIRGWWRSLGWKKDGYHFLIKPNGEVVNLVPIEQPSNGVAGHNYNSIHISYIGGIDGNGKAVDNRTDAQKQSQILLLQKLRKQFPTAEIKGHRDFPGVTKSCPSFNVREWLDCVGIH